jgi:hypothetical protein
LSQLRNLYTGNPDAWSFRELLSYSAIKSRVQNMRGANAAIVRLPKTLSAWNYERVSKRTNNAGNANLSLDEINAVRTLIEDAISKSTIKNHTVFTDQLFFLTIGAIQIESQTHSNDAWKLLNKTIETHLKPKNERQLLLVGVLITTLMVGMSAMQMTHKQGKVSPVESQGVFIEASTSTADPVTISMLQLAYNKMKSGTCQLPQAAMLPERQRQAFLAFVNQGTIDVNNVENLRQAFGYVSCLYPQELMRPLTTAL